MRDRRGIQAARRRRSAGGFSLIELMVVVILVSLLAVMAIPMLRTSRDDRIAFDAARNYEGIIHRAQSRAMGTGGAHLVVISRSTRGNIHMFEAVDTTLAPNGPKPVSSCKIPGQWNNLAAWTANSPDPPNIRWIAGYNLDAASGVNADMNLLSNLTDNTGGNKQVIVLCFTPSGNVYEASGGSPAGAAASLSTALPFGGFVDIEIARHTQATVKLGLARHVIVAGGSAEIRSL